MFEKYKQFLANLSVNIYGKAGVVLTTSSFVSFLFFELARISGIITNAYIGLITYLLFPALFVIGLGLIPIGWRQVLRQSGKTTKQLLNEKFTSSEIKEGFFGSKLSLKIGLFTAINLIFLLFAATQMLSFMDQPEFCGTACHSVMNPEWVTYQQSSHARVKCVDCHVGQGVDALVSSKLNGLWQMISVTFNLYDQPIPTPVHQLRPARETCETCHWPEKFYGDELKTYVTYLNDETSSSRYSNLLLKIDAGKAGNVSGIHWHIAPENQVRYQSVNDQREEMLVVEVLQDDGNYKRYTNHELLDDKDVSEDNSNWRNMDCVDCHNRATHIYEDPEEALDQKLYLGLIDKSLPFIRREGLRAISKIYPEKSQGIQAIAIHIRNFYRRTYPQIATTKMEQIDNAIDVLQQIYHRNIHPEMNIEWGSYPDHIGHRNNGGCFRCHNQRLEDTEGKHMVNDCTTCHSILALQEKIPLKYIKEVEENERGAKMHEYLRDEFFKYSSE